MNYDTGTQFVCLCLLKFKSLQNSGNKTLPQIMQKKTRLLVKGTM